MHAAMSEPAPQSPPAEDAGGSGTLLWTPSEDAYTWERLPTDEAAVLAAVDGLAGAFELKLARAGRWRIGALGPDVLGTLAVRPDSAASASVGLHFEELEDTGIGWITGVLGLVAPLLLTPPLLWFALIAGLPRLVILVLTLVVFMTPVILADRAVRALRTHRARRVIAGWRGRFMPALAARLAPGQPYR
jgi:hypothetical protein